MTRRRREKSSSSSAIPSTARRHHVNVHTGSIGDPFRVLYAISMGTREMPHPLCCISLDLAGLGARSPSPADPPPRAGEGEAGPADSVTFCGALYKWTNIRKGWRLRWFSLHDGVLSYSKIARRDLPTVPSGSRVRLIGNSSSMFSSSYSRGGCGCRQPRMPVRLVQLKVRNRCDPHSLVWHRNWKKKRLKKKSRISFYFVSSIPRSIGGWCTRSAEKFTKSVKFLFYFIMLPVLSSIQFSGCEVSVPNESSPKHRMDGEDVASESEQRDPKHVRTESRPCPLARRRA